MWLAKSAAGHLAAFKVLTADGRARPDQVIRFEAEGRLLARLGGSHHLVTGKPVPIAGSTDPGPIALDLADESLADRIEPRPLPWRLAVLVIRQVLDATAWLHANGVIHRDIKPSNVLMMEDGTVRLADLGVAAHGDPPRGLPDDWIEEEIGTLGYAAPELLAVPATATPAVDIYSVGVTLFEAVSRRLPHPMLDGETEAEHRVRLADGPAPLSLGALGLDLPAALVEVTARALAPDPAERFPSAAAMAASLPTA
ncbi:MAG: serine/threonine-protein kinase [Gemmatimonadales bacterium]|nr:serine/threonine-protein kinase [Gemmatimonadales bacterium]